MFQEKQTAGGKDDEYSSANERVRVIRQSEFEFARPQAAPRKSRPKTASPSPPTNPSQAPPTSSASRNAITSNQESKSALIWRYIQDQSGTKSVPSIDSALESVRASSNNLKQNDSNTILANCECCSSSTVVSISF